jgi:hypothetical protein
MLTCLRRCLQQTQVEQEEEFLINKLMKRLEQLKKEKQLLATEVRSQTYEGEATKLQLRSSNTYLAPRTSCRLSKRRSF